MDAICLKGMAFFGRHGALPEENALGQRFYIDVKLFLPLAEAGRSDCLSDTVNYAVVYEIVRAVAEEERYSLIERLAGEINQRVLSAFPAVLEIETTVHKPSAPVSGVLEDVSVTLGMGRNNE